MDSITISGAAVCTVLGLFWQVARVKADHAARMATMEQRIISLEARAKHADASLDGIRSELAALREAMVRVETLLRGRTPAPR
jgi:hypothetical protein